MEEIVKVLLQEGIDEETIHEVLDVIVENYEIVDETVTVGDAVKAAKKVQGSRAEAASKSIDVGGFNKAFNREAFANALSRYPEDSKVPLKTLLQAAKNSLKPREEKYEEGREEAHHTKKGFTDMRYSKQHKPFYRATKRVLKARDLTKTNLPEED